ncbi:hypothetical protein AMECASPLE_015221 [Ameca splendens]|uniref:Uncharacterized protein n=1 Tax=Ameca splendens TaxID=208324 RepID=A0ABV1A869_9TELE
MLATHTRTCAFEKEKQEGKRVCHANPPPNPSMSTCNLTIRAPRLTPIGTVHRVPTKEGGIGTSTGPKARDRHRVPRTDRKPGPPPPPPHEDPTDPQQREAHATTTKTAAPFKKKKQNTPHKGGHMTTMPNHRTHGAEPTERPVPDAQQWTAAKTRQAGKQKSSHTKTEAANKPHPTQNVMPTQIWWLLNLLLSGSRTKRTLSTLRRTYLQIRHQYSSLTGTEFIHPAPLCLSLIQSSIHPTMFSACGIIIPPLTPSSSPEKMQLMHRLRNLSLLYMFIIVNKPFDLLHPVYDSASGPGEIPENMTEIMPLLQN